MISVPTMIVATKIASWFLLAVLAFIFGLANSGRAAGRAAAERGAARRRAGDGR
jgi:hypothetical protein